MDISGACCCVRCAGCFLGQYPVAVILDIQAAVRSARPTLASRLPDSKGNAKPMTWIMSGGESSDRVLYS